MASNPAVTYSYARALNGNRQPTEPTMSSVTKQILCSLVAVLLAGCGIEQISRVNHLHNDPNQKTAQAALDSFEGFANEQTGLAATLLKNLHTQSAHNRGLNELRVGVDETDLTITLTD